MTTPEMRAGQQDPSFQPAASPGNAGGTAQQIADEAKTQARQVKNQVAEKARSTVQQARERASSTVGERKSRIADQLGSVANAFQRTTEQLHSEGQDQLAGYGDSLVEQANRAADYLRRADLQSVQRDVENLARRQPALIIGSAFALGLLGARFFKSSERRDQVDYQGDQSY
jgi:cell division septum initiation protein DivIVA